eukprot:568196-Amphidinium_carterae.1
MVNQDQQAEAIEIEGDLRQCELLLSQLRLIDGSEGVVTLRIASKTSELGELLDKLRCQHCILQRSDEVMRTMLVALELDAARCAQSSCMAATVLTWPGTSR